VIADLTFHDLRHDFAHRAREAAWSPEEVAYYLGRGTRSGVATFPVPPGSLQVKREQVKQKLKLIKG